MYQVVHDVFLSLEPIEEAPCGVVRVEVVTQFGIPLGPKGSVTRRTSIVITACVVVPRTASGVIANTGAIIRVIIVVM